MRAKLWTCHAERRGQHAEPDAGLGHNGDRFAAPRRTPPPRRPTTEATLMQPLRRGESGSAVAEVRRMLATIGLLDNTDPAAAGRFDDATELAVRHFQQRRGISV